MSKDRFKRILIVVFVVFLVLVGAKVFADWQGEKRTQGEALSLPTKEISEKINDFGEQILGKAIEVLPGGTEIKEKIESQPEPFSQVEEMIQETKPEEKVENKTQEIIEIIKQLPAEQLEIIKKQIFEDFCREILKE